MTIEASVVPSIISAVSGFVGVLVGGLITWARESLQERRRLSREATYLAILVGAHLEKFVRGCLDVAYDDGTHEGMPAADGHTFHKETVSIPLFEPLLLDVDWKSLPPNIMYKILNIPSRVDQITRRLRDPGYDDPPDYFQYFRDRRRSFAKLGVDVIVTARELRTHAGLMLATDDEDENDLIRQLRVQGGD